MIVEPIQIPGIHKRGLTWLNTLNRVDKAFDRSGFKTTKQRNKKLQLDTMINTKH